MSEEMDGEVERSILYDLKTFQDAFLKHLIVCRRKFQVLCEVIDLIKQEFENDIECYVGQHGNNEIKVNPEGILFTSGDSATRFNWKDVFVRLSNPDEPVHRLFVDILLGKVILTPYFKKETT
jgi:hypothetical protein